VVAAILPIGHQVPSVYPNPIHYISSSGWQLNPHTTVGDNGG